MHEGQVAVVGLLKSDQQFPESVEPAVADLDHPTPVLRRSSALLLPLLSNSRQVAAVHRRPQCMLPGVSPIRQQVHASLPTWLDYDVIQKCLQLSYIIAVCCGYAYRQRDPTLVDEKVSFAPIFFPGPWGFALRTLAPVAP